MYHGALHKIPTQTVDSSQVYERWILQKQPQMINKMTKKWDRITISDLEQVCPKQAKTSSVDCCRQRHFYLD